MHDLQLRFAERVAAGLKRKSLTRCSRWAEECRVMGGASFPGPWTFKNHPWLLEMHDSTAELNVGQKSAQMGYTETVMNIVFYSIDIKGMDCLYVLPNEHPDATDFSAARFAPALELSSHLANLFSDVNNVGHKRAGTSNLYVRSSRSRSQLKSIPTGLIILDEVDEMEQKNIPLALERASGQTQKQVWMVSTATIPGKGINLYYEKSSQNHFVFRCPACSRFTELLWPESFVITATDINDVDGINQSHIICKECKAKLDHETKAEWLKAKGRGGNAHWVPQHAGRDSAGWHINQMYSPAIKPKDFATAFLRGTIDPSAEIEFYNSKLGLPFVVEGARVTEENIETAKRGHRRSDCEINPNRLRTLGVDVGKWLHFEINEWWLPTGDYGVEDVNTYAKPKVLTHGKVRDFEELDELMYQWQIHFAVIDANPERRKALEFASRFQGHVRLCFYGRGVQGRTLNLHFAEPQVTVDRTAWLDLSLGRFRRPKNHEAILLPADIDMEYREHIIEPVRVYNIDSSGNPVGEYVNTKPDHYAHARNYAEIALPLAVSLTQAENITSPV